MKWQQKLKTAPSRIEGKVLPIILFVLLALVTVAGLYYGWENWRGHRAWGAYKQTHKTKVYVPLAELVPPRVPDADNFAATPFLAPLFDFVPGTQTPRDREAWDRAIGFAKELPNFSYEGGFQRGVRMDLVKIANGFPEAKEVNDRKQAAAAILDALSEYHPMLTEIRSASKRPFSRFNIRYEEANAAGILLPHLAVLKRFSQVLVLDAASNLELGKPGPAFDDVMLIFYLSDADRDEPTLISGLVRLAIFKIGTQVLWEGMASRQWTDDQCRGFQTWAERHDYLDAMGANFRGEQAFGNSVIEYLKDHRDELQAVLSNDPAIDSSEVWLLRYAPRGWFEQEQLNYNRNFAEFINAGFDARARRVYPERSEEGQLKARAAGGTGAAADHRLMSSLLIPAVASVHPKFSHAQVTLDQILLAAALERRFRSAGKYPESLEELVPGEIKRVPPDIFDGKPLRYRRDGERYIIYSVGWNRVDDGGVVQGKEKAQDLRVGDWVWGYQTAPQDQPDGKQP